MIIVDKALEKRHLEGNPIRVAMVGAGFIGRGVALQMVTSMVGMRLAAISNRTLPEAVRAYREAGVDSMDIVETVETAAQLDDAITRGLYAVTDDPVLLCQAENIDVVIEVTGEVEFAARVAMEAIEQGKHFVMNAELDATLGPILKVHADRAGVVVTDTDGDQPGAIMNLYRFVKTIGFQPVLAGNIKAFLEHHSTPDTQRTFAARHHQGPRSITGFADGTKISLEMAVVANATGFRAGTRGMYGPRCGHVKEALNCYPMEQLLDGGLVDYIIGAEPGPGIFVLGYNAHPIKKQYMNYFKMGDGPLYVFYTPYHLTHLEMPLTAARAVLFQDAALAPRGEPVCEVMTLAKRDLKSGEVLDGIGGYTCYGVIENADLFRAGNMLPMGLSQGCRLKQDIPKDRWLTYDDVHVPDGRLSDRLRAEQDAHFNTA